MIVGKRRVQARADTSSKKMAYEKEGDPNPRLLYGMLFLLGHCGQTLYVVSRVKFNDYWESSRTGTRRHKFKKKWRMKKNEIRIPGCSMECCFCLEIVAKR